MVASGSIGTLFGPWRTAADDGNALAASPGCAGGPSWGLSAGFGRQGGCADQGQNPWQVTLDTAWTKRSWSLGIDGGLALPRARQILGEWPGNSQKLAGQDHEGDPVLLAVTWNDL